MREGQKPGSIKPEVKTRKVTLTLPESLVDELVELASDRGDSQVSETFKYLFAAGLRIWDEARKGNRFYFGPDPEHIMEIDFNLPPEEAEDVSLDTCDDIVDEHEVDLYWHESDDRATVVAEHMEDL